MNASGSGTSAGEQYVQQQPRNRLDRFFMISARGSTTARELRGGIVTFFAMSYIVVLNPLIIGTAEDATGATLGVERVAAGTALVAGVLTLLMGVVGRYPLALATGLGLNAFVAVALATQMTWAEAMGLIVLEGLIITVLVLTGFRRAVFEAVPLQLKTAIGVGIGLFIAFVGLVDGGIVRRTSPESGMVPVQLGVDGNLQGWPTLVFVVGLLLTALLVARGVKGAILIGIVVATVLSIVVEAVLGVGAATGDRPAGWGLVVPTLPDELLTVPDFSLLGQVDLVGAFLSAGVITAVLFVFTLLLADFFDTMGTVVGVGAEAGLLDRSGRLPGVGRVLFVDSLAAAAGGAASVSSNTAYVESAAGVGEGARTGLASLVTGSLFLVAMFFTPLVSVVPFEAATPALVVVGFLMATQIRNIDWTDYAAGIPAFLTMILMPFTFSITNGIGAGFISYAVIRIAQGRARELHWLLWLVTVLFVAYFAIEPIRSALGAG